MTEILVWPTATRGRRFDPTRTWMGLNPALLQDVADELSLDNTLEADLDLSRARQRARA